MSEYNKGLHSIIRLPVMYNIIQFIAGARMYRDRMVREYIRPFEGCRIMDIGCGTGEYVDTIDRYCSCYEYHGFDAEDRYIAYARKLFERRSEIHLYHQSLTEDTIEVFTNFDIVLAIGIMHHLEDCLVLSLLQLAKKALKPGGRLVTYDPGQFSDMSRMEKFFVNHDRGRNIRSPGHYDRLVSQVFPVREMHLPYLTYYRSRNVVFNCRNDSAVLSPQTADEVQICGRR